MDYHELEKARPTMPKHHCTDLLCCLLFVAHVTAFVIVCIYGYSKGNPDLILYPYDISGNQCGRPGTVTSGYDYLYFVSPVEYPAYTVCVQDCGNPVTCYQNSWVLDCSFNITADNSRVSIPISYTGYGLLHFCIPETFIDVPEELTSTLVDFVSSKLNDSGSLEWAHDIMHTWQVVLIVLAASLGFSLFYLLLLRMCAMVIVYLTIIAITLGLVGFGYLLDKTAQEKYPSQTQHTPHETLEIVSYCFYAGAALFVVIMLFMWRRIELAVAITKSAVGFMGEVCSILIIPLISFGVTIGLVCIWIFALVYLYSCGTLSNQNSYKAFGNITWDTSTRDAFYYVLIGFVWVIEFKIFLTQLAIALVVCYWYFDHGAERKHHHKVFQAYWTAIRYHMGSVAFAALLLTLVKLIKWFLEYLQKKVYKEHFQGNFAFKLICGCVGCYVNCFERFIKFLDKNALISLAYSSHSFCASAKEVLALMIENAARFVALGSIGELFGFLGKTLITLATTALGFVIITRDQTYKSEITSPVGPTFVFFIVGYCVSCLFMSVFEMVCDCIIIFYLEDEKQNGSKASMNAPKPLHDFMEAHRNKEDKTCCYCL